MQRLLRHMLIPAWWRRRVLPPSALRNIEAAIGDSERHHYGELRFVVEAHLGLPALMHGVTAHERAIELFSQLRIWDTEQNNGVLIYLLLADRDVEIIADRGINNRVGSAQWESICQQMEQQFRQQRFEAGVMHGIQAISALLIQHFPASTSNINELPDTAIVM